MLPISDLKRHNESCKAEIDAAVGRVLCSGWYILGSEVAAFEREFADYCGVDHCIGVASGSDALELALRAVGVEPGDEVVTVANAGTYSTCAILNVGAHPVYADVDENSMTMDANSAQVAVSPRTAAIVVTHLYGRLADMSALSALAHEADVPIVEDCAQAHGARRENKRAGSHGAAGCFSFYPTKNLGALGDGGAVVTDNAAIAERVRQLRQYGWTTKYVVSVEGGRNSRLDEMQAAVLRAKLGHLDRWNARRQAIANAYVQGITRSDFALPTPIDEGYIAHLFVVRTSGRDALRAHLRANGIATEIHYPLPDHLQPAYSARRGTISLPITERLAGEIVTLPCFPEMTNAEVDHMIGECARWNS
jgi:aminotransferase EvaB